MCTSPMWSPESGLVLPLLFVMLHCHQQYFAFFILLLYYHYLITVMLFGILPLSNWLQWLKESIPSLLSSNSLSFILTERWRLPHSHSGLQVSVEIFSIISTRYFKYSKDVTGHVDHNANRLLFPPEYREREVFIIEGLFYGTIYNYFSVVETTFFVFV